MNFNLQPSHLNNHLVKLLPLQEDHFEELYKVASDELIWQQHPNPNRYKKEIFQNYFTGAIQSKGAFLLQDSQTNEIIGSSRFYDFNEEKSEVLVGYTFIARKYWGTIYNQEIKNLMMNYAFQYVNNIIFHIGANNIRSQKAITKLGAIKIDEFLVEYYGEEPKLNYIYKISKPVS